MACDTLGGMRYLIPLCVLFSSCELFSTAAAVAKDPEVATLAMKAGSQAFAGEWYGAAYSAAALAALVAGRWFHGRVKKSEPGSVIG